MQSAERADARRQRSRELVPLRTVAKTEKMNMGP